MPHLIAFTAVTNVDWGYQSIMGLAIATGFVISRFTQSALTIDRVSRFGILMGAFCGAMIGAKLPFLFSDWQQLVSGQAWLQNGKTILCGLVGGYVGVEVAKWTFDVRTKTGDSFAIPVATSIAIGRLGCFHAGCCYGTATTLPWAVVFPNVDALTRHPTQVYESIFHGCAALVLVLLWQRRWLAGQLIKAYIVAYAAYRFLSEIIRPEPRMLGGLTAYQWLSIAIILVFAGLWYRDAQSIRRLQDAAK